MFDGVLNTPLVCHEKRCNIDQILKENLSTSAEGQWNSSLVLSSRKEGHIFDQYMPIIVRM